MRAAASDGPADALSISLSTIKTHSTSLMRKLGARNRVEVAVWAYETGASGTDVDHPPSHPRRVCHSSARTA